MNVSKSTLARLLFIFSLVGSLGLPTVSAQAQAVDNTANAVSSFSHVVVVIQENRTPDNLFQGLCEPPYGNNSACSTTPTSSQYDIQTRDWVNKHSPTGTTQPGKVPLAGDYDLGHSHTDWESMCDVAGGTCKMDGAWNIKCGPEKDCPPNPQFRYVDNSTGIVNPYLDLATQYGWANEMFQTNQGPSFPAHQFLFGGTSAPTALDDARGVFSSENMKNSGIGGVNATAGCTAKKDTTVALIGLPGGESKNNVYPCFEHETMPDLLPPALTWRYYAPSAGSIWTAPNAIEHICQSTGPGGECKGPEWTDNVDLTSADVFQDIANCNLRSMSWVVPNGANSDHAHDNDGGGPSWVSAIVNAIGENTNCDSSGYWNDTAIVITWDDWGGWYDHQAPTIEPGVEGDYQYGFRVPLIAVSAYTPTGYINNSHHDFGSILRFMESNFGLQEGALTFADERSKTNLGEFFDFKMAPRQFQEIAAPKKTDFFINDTRPVTAPDDD